jgi:hypothetical protein
MKITNLQKQFDAQRIEHPDNTGDNYQSANDWTIGEPFEYHALDGDVEKMFDLLMDELK